MQKKADALLLEAKLKMQHKFAQEQGSVVSMR